MSNPAGRFERATVAAISIGFVIWSAVFIYRSSFLGIDGQRYFCLFDDAMIGMRYGWQLAHGSGFTWNPGEFVLGYSNLLMVLLYSFATLIFDKSAAALFIQIVGAGFMLAIAFATMRIADHIVDGDSNERKVLVRTLAFLCALSYYPLAYWSLMGMETGLLTLLLLSGILFAFSYTKTKNPARLFLMAGCLGGAYLTRNDSIIFAMAVWLYVAWEMLEATSRRFGQLFAAFTLYALVILGQTVFQYLYYGELLPNTYTLKLAGIPLDSRIRDGIRFVTPFLIVTTPMLIVAAVDLFFDFHKRKLLLLVVVLSSIGYQVYVGGEPWNYWRIMSPSMPLAAILFIAAISAIVRALSTTQPFAAYCLRNPIFPKKYATEVLVTSLTLIGLLVVNAPFLLEVSMFRKPYTAEANKRNVDIAIALTHVTTSKASVAVFWAGAIPYFTNGRAIDILGKSDKYIAHLPPDLSGAVTYIGMKSVPGHNKYDLNYSIKSLEPTYVQAFQWGTQDLSEWAATRYVKVEYEGIGLSLLRDSPAVLWDKVQVATTH